MRPALPPALLASLLACAGCASGEAPRSAHGYLQTRYRGRWDATAPDHDVYQVVSVDVGDPSRSPWSAHVLGQAALDLADTGASSPFFELSDTYSGPLTAHLYHAYAERRDAGPFERLRLGRQILWDTPTFASFDGLLAETAPWSDRAVQVGGYGGLPAYTYRSRSSDDALVGLYAQARPWDGGRLRLDWMHVRDEQAATAEDDLFALAAWQDVTDGLSLEGRYSRLEDTHRDVRLAALFVAPEAAFTLSASYYRLLRTQADLTEPLDPFFSSLQELFPYQQGQLLLSKVFGERLTLQGGLDLRRVTDDADVGPFNRDFDRYHATAVLDGVLPAGTTLSLTAESWDSAANDFRTWGLDLSRAFGPSWNAAVGSYFSLYKYDYLSGQERDRVRTYYVRLDHRPDGPLDLDLRYELEDIDFELYHMLRLGVTWRF